MEGSLAVEGSASGAGITTFTNEACEEVSAIGGFTHSTIAKAQPALQDIKAYFERPRLVVRGSLSFGVRTNVFSTYISPSTLSGIFPQWAQRLSGAYGIRYTVNFRLQVAATPFHQGVYVMCAQYGGFVSATNFNRGQFSPTCTNLPHVRLDLSESTMAELRVPFLNRDEFHGIDVAVDDPMCFFSLTTVLPTNAVTGLSAPTYEIYAYLTDIELFGADNFNPTTITLQSGLSSFGKELKEARVLSKSLDGVARVSSFVTKNVPSLSSFAGPVGWAAGTLAGIAKYFGYSRPLLQDPVMRVFQSNYTGESNVDVPMAGFACGLMQSNTLAMTPDVGGSDVDEMALSFVTSQWSQVCVGAVTDTDTHSKVIYAAPVSPACMWFRARSSAPYCNRLFPKDSSFPGGDITNGFMPSSLFYISSFFRLWRGGIKFRFTFAKTKFHGGRYMVSFNPGVDFKVDAFSGFNTIQGPEVAGGLVQPYGYSQIMDLRDGNIFEFTVPYMIGTPYLPFCSSTGGISVVCMDPLQVTSTVTNSVPFLVEVCGDSDYELADFAGPWFVPFPAATITQQSGGEIVTSATTSPSHMTIGERIMSVKQMIQSPSWIRINTVTGSNLSLLYPWFVYSPVAYLNSIKATPMPATAVINGNTTCGALAKCYAFARGGSDYHAYSGGDGVRFVIDQGPQDGYANYRSGNKDFGARQTTGSTPKVVSDGKNACHVRCPAFCPRARVQSHILDDKSIPGAGPTTDFTIFDARSHVDRMTSVSNGGTYTIWLARCAADDASLVHYMGPTPLWIMNADTTITTDNDWY